MAAAAAAGDAGSGASTTLPWRVAALWIILLASYLGCLTPVLLLKKARRGKGRFHGRRCMHLLKTFSGGVVVSVGYCHVLPEARRALDGTGAEGYPVADAVAMAGSLLTLIMGQVVNNLVHRMKARSDRLAVLAQLRLNRRASATTTTAAAGAGARPLDPEAGGAAGAASGGGGGGSSDGTDEEGQRSVVVVELTSSATASTVLTLAEAPDACSSDLEPQPQPAPPQQAEAPAGGRAGHALAHHPPSARGGCGSSGRLPAEGAREEQEPAPPRLESEPTMSEAESVVYCFNKEPLVVAYMMEIGIVFHSILIGVGLGLQTRHVEDVRALTCAIAVHQFFEGAGLSTCIIEAGLSRWKRRLMFGCFALTTSAGIALGIGISSIYDAQSRAAAITQGFFNALAAGILIYLGLAELLAEEYAKEDVRADHRLQHRMMVATLAGAAVMAVLAVYA